MGRIIFDQNYWFEGAPKFFKLGAQALLKRKESVEPCLLLLIWVLSRFFTVILKVNIIWLRNLRQVNTLTVVKCKLTCAYLTLFKKLLLKFCNLSSCRSSEHCFRMCVDQWLYVKRCLKISAEETHSHGGGHMRQLYLTLPSLLRSIRLSLLQVQLQSVFLVHYTSRYFCSCKYTSLSCSRPCYIIFNKKNTPLILWQFFLSVGSKMDRISIFFKVSYRS